MTVPVYPLKGGDFSVEEFTTQLAAIQDSVSERKNPLDAIDDLRELVSKQDMQVLRKQPQMGAGVLKAVDTIIVAHENHHSAVDAEQGLENIQRMADAQILREQLMQQRHHLRAFSPSGTPLRPARREDGWAADKSPTKHVLRIFTDGDGNNPDTRPDNPGGDSGTRNR